LTENEIASVNLKLRAAVERHELDSVERKFHRHDGSRRSTGFLGGFFAITRDLPDLRILKKPT